MLTALHDFFLVCWQMLTDSVWWALIISTLIEMATKGASFSSTYLPIGVFTVVFSLMFAIYFFIIRSMHRFLWARWYSLAGASIFAVLPAAMATLALTAYFTQGRINSTIDNWGVAMKLNPQCWAPNAAGEFERRLSKEGAKAEEIDGRTYVSLTPPAGADASLATSNTENFTKSATVLSGMVMDAFLEDFPTLSSFVELDPRKAANALANESYAFWSSPPAAKGEGGKTPVTRQYTGDSLAPYVNVVTAQAKEVTPRIAYSMLTFTIVLALLSMLPGIAIIYFDLDKQIRMGLRG